MVAMSQRKTRDRKAKKKRWKQHQSAGETGGGGGSVRDPSTRVTGPLATIVGLSVVGVAVVVVALLIFNILK